MVPKGSHSSPSLRKNISAAKSRLFQKPIQSTTSRYLPFPLNFPRNSPDHTLKAITLEKIPKILPAAAIWRVRNRVTARPMMVPLQRKNITPPSGKISGWLAQITVCDPQTLTKNIFLTPIDPKTRFPPEASLAMKIFVKIPQSWAEIFGKWLIQCT